MIRRYSFRFRAVVLTVTLIAIGGLLLIPLISVFGEALRNGRNAAFLSFSDPDFIAAVRLSLFVVVVVIPLNLIFGVSVAWLTSHFRFPGRQIILLILEMPMWISPVISGLIFTLVFGAQGWLGPWLSERGIQIIFAFPGIAIASTFITMPLIARELIPLMQEQGFHEEEAARVLGASALQTFRLVTLPKIWPGILQGLIQTNARVLGEFGAVSVVSGHIRGLTNTLPLHIEALYNEYNQTAAFASAALLAVIAILTIAARQILEGSSYKQ